MRGADTKQAMMFSMLSPEKRVPSNHPLRAVKALADAALGNFELGAGFALAAFGGQKEHAAAFALGYHALQLIPTLILGGLMLPLARKRPPAGLPPQDGLLAPSLKPEAGAAGP